MLFGVVLAIASLEVALRATGWLFLHMRRVQVSLPANETRQYVILCIGESTTAGLRVLGGDATYPKQLERILNERGNGARVTVINGGVPAATTDALLERLPKQLEKPVDLVVAMIGINDGESSTAAFQISGRLRVWKLAKMLWVGWRKARAGEAAPKQTAPPDEALWIAWDRVLEGKYDEARTWLQPIVEQDEWLVHKSRASGMMAVASWQESEDAEAERHHARFLQLERRIPRSRTVDNYRKLRTVLAGRGIPLVAVQYPGMPLDLLRDIAGKDPSIVFVDNEWAFLEAVKTMPARDVYRDLFGGVFGHMTLYGNRMLAENVANAILPMLADPKGPSPRESKHE